ncbi:unnamed protein product [Closterium sp. Yama58-4]|nr:unnamed protein product [Closterium sp. Yama58-4]
MKAPDTAARPLMLPSRAPGSSPASPPASPPTSLPASPPTSPCASSSASSPPFSLPAFRDRLSGTGGDEGVMMAAADDSVFSDRYSCSEIRSLEEVLTDLATSARMPPLVTRKQPASDVAPQGLHAEEASADANGVSTNSNTAGSSTGSSNAGTNGRADERDETEEARVVAEEGESGRGVVIVTVLSEAWIPMLKILEFCCSLRLHCFLDTQEDAPKSERDDFSGGQKKFMTPSYLHLNPLPHLLPVSSDLLIACDRWSADPKAAAANGGFYMARSNDRVLRFFDYWISAHTRFPGIHDQDAFMRVRPEADPYTRDTLRLAVHYLPTDRFGGFCQIGRQLGWLVTVHANCCIGLEEKMRALQRVG